MYPETLIGLSEREQVPGGCGRSDIYVHLEVTSPFSGNEKHVPSISWCRREETLRKLTWTIFVSDLVTIIALEILPIPLDFICKE